MFTVAQAAEHLQPSTVHRAIKVVTLPALKVSRSYRLSSRAMESGDVVGKVLLTV